jgi:uncharacterized protein YodC (DUF2158 family)
MEPKPGDVVMLKSGGSAMTVVEVNDNVAACVWMGEEGDLFRETLPLAVLEIVELSDDEDEEDDEADDETAAESSKVA